MHVFLSVLSPLPLNNPRDTLKVAGALRGAAAGVGAKLSAQLRQARVAHWEVKIRTPDHSGAWRVVVSTPTGTS